MVDNEDPTDRRKRLANQAGANGLLKAMAHHPISLWVGLALAAAAVLTVNENRLTKMEAVSEASARIIGEHLKGLRLDEALIAIATLTERVSGLTEEIRYMRQVIDASDRHMGGYPREPGTEMRPE